MRLCLLTLLTYLITYWSVFSQDLSGIWSGTINQGNSPAYQFDLTINQTGNALSGTDAVHYTARGVTEKFRGVYSLNEVTITETDVVEYTKDPNLVVGSWCLKILKGKLSTKGSDQVLEGIWTSASVFSPESGYRPGTCIPGTFRVSKSLLPTAAAKSSLVEPTFSGQIIDKHTRAPVRSILSIEREGSPRQAIHTLDDGLYTFKGLANASYVISISAVNYEPLAGLVSTNKASATTNFFLTATAAPAQPATKVSQPIRLTNVLFELQTANLLPASFTELNLIVRQMQLNARLRIQLEGHTDYMLNASAQADIDLSHERVKTIKDYLLSKHIASDRIETKGYGHSKLICTPPCEANRRVEFVILEQ